MFNKMLMDDQTHGYIPYLRHSTDAHEYTGEP